MNCSIHFDREENVGSKKFSHSVVDRGLGSFWSTVLAPYCAWNARRSWVKSRSSGSPKKLHLVGLRNLDLKHRSQGDLMQKVLLTKLSPRLSDF